MVRIFGPVDYLVSLLVCAVSFWLTVYGGGLALLTGHVIWQRRTA